MPLGSILATVAAYVAIAILLLSLNLASRWRWWIKGGAIVVTGLFFIGSYFAIVSLLGWPSAAMLPDAFSLVATRVVEPDKFTGAPGYIYLWLEELDANNVPSGRPRSYRLAYTEELAGAVETAQTTLDDGDVVEGRVEEAPAETEGSEAGDLAPGAVGGQGGTATTYVAPEFNIVFNDLPPVALPDKGPL